MSAEMNGKLVDLMPILEEDTQASTPSTRRALERLTNYVMQIPGALRAIAGRVDEQAAKSQEADLRLAGEIAGNTRAVEALRVQLQKQRRDSSHEIGLVVDAHLEGAIERSMNERELKQYREAKARAEVRNEQRTTDIENARRNARIAYVAAAIGSLAGIVEVIRHVFH